MPGTPKLDSISTKQTRIAELAKQMPGIALKTLAHHMDQDWLREAYRRTRKNGAVGADGQTAEDFAANLEENLQSLMTRAKSGAYRAPPVRRVHIPKGSGDKTRPIGIPTFEDKILQRAVVMLLEPIYEQDFYDFSYGFRPGRSAHDAVDALDRAVHEMGGGWILEVDVQSYYDTVVHKRTQQMLRQRVVDGVVTRLIGKWLKAGVLENGTLKHTELGVPQGGVVSPLISNVYLHEVLDEWWVQQVLPCLSGKARLIRYADDFVMVFADRSDALRVQKVLPKRFNRYGLALHPEKTRLVQFRRPPSSGGEKPGSFNFLGFTFHWGRTRRGKWICRQKTAKDRLNRAILNFKDWMRRNRHIPVGDQAKALGRKLQGHFNYFGIVGNSLSLHRLHYAVRCWWRYWLSRRTQKSIARMTWEKFNRLLKRYPLPPARLPMHLRRRRLAKL